METCGQKKSEQTKEHVAVNSSTSHDGEESIRQSSRLERMEEVHCWPMDHMTPEKGQGKIR